MFAQNDYTKYAMDFINNDSTVTCIDSLFCRVKLKDLDIIFKQVDKIGNELKQNMSQFGFLALKFAHKQYFMIEE